jgi:hypothetical protein
MPYSLMCFVTKKQFHRWRISAKKSAHAGRLASPSHRTPEIEMPVPGNATFPSCRSYLDESVLCHPAGEHTVWAENIKAEA